MAYSRITISNGDAIEASWGNKIEENLERLGTYMGVVASEASLPAIGDAAEGDWYWCKAERTARMKIGSFFIAVNVSSESSAAAPSNPVKGNLWYDSTNDILKVYNGASWNQVGEDTYLKLSGGTLTGDINFADKIAQRSEIKDYSETVKNHGTTSGTVTLNIEDGNIHKIVAGGNITFSIANPPASGKAGSLTIYLTQGSTARTISWPSSVKWSDGDVPDLSRNYMDYLISLMTFDGGTTWLGMLSGRDFS